MATGETVTVNKRQLLLCLGATLWPSFLAATVASVVFFASIDPASLHMQTLPHWDISRMAGYSIGFFMFWAVGLAASLLTYLLSGQGRNQDRNQGRNQDQGQGEGRDTNQGQRERA